MMCSDTSYVTVERKKESTSRFEDGMRKQKQRSETDFRPSNHHAMEYRPPSSQKRDQNNICNKEAQLRIRKRMMLRGRAQRKKTLHDVPLFIVSLYWKRKRVVMRNRIG